MVRGRILVLQPPSPPYLNVMRDYAGGYGVASKSSREDYGHEGGLVPHVSLLYGAAVLQRAGFDVSFIDGQAEELGRAEVSRRVGEIAPEVIVAIVSLPSMAGDLELLGALRRESPSSKLVCIGTVCKQLAEAVLAYEHVTAVVQGDSEVILPALATAVLEGSDLSEVKGIAFRGPDGEVVATPDAEVLADLNALPMPPYDLLPMDRYWHGSFGQDVKYMEILDSRGCPFPCAVYCPYPFAFGKKMLFMDAKRVVDEMELLNKRFGTVGFILRGQTFTLKRQHAEGICREIIERKLRLRWLVETRLDCVDGPLLSLMKEAGCEWVHYGLESGDAELFAKVGKPGCKLADLGRSIRETQKAGLFARVNVILGLPGESWQSVRRTIKTLKEWRPDSVLAAIITPYPGTATYEEAKQKGLLLSESWSEFTGFHPVMRTEYMSADDLIAAQRAIENSLNDGWTVRGAAVKAISFVRSATTGISHLP